MTITDLKQIQLYRQHVTNKIKCCSRLEWVTMSILVNAFNALKIRCSDKIITDNFGDGLVKNWTIRGTVHIFSQSDLPLYIHKSQDSDYLSHDWGTENIRRDCKTKPGRLEYIARLIIEKVANGITTRDCLKVECLQAGILEFECSFIFDQWRGLLAPLCKRGFLCYIVQEKKEFMICPPFDPIDIETALIEQARRYFTNYAPAAIRDTAYYFGWTQAFTKEIMQKLPLNQIKIDGKDYYYLEKLKGNYPDIPRCLLIAGFDPLMLGYQKKDSIYLSQKNIRGIFNLAGIVMPTILLNGNVVGKWRMKNSNIKFELFESVDDLQKNILSMPLKRIFAMLKRQNGCIVKN